VTDRSPGTSRTVFTTVSAATLAVLPSMLLGGLALLVRDELDFGAFELGAAIAVFFTASALVSVPAGVLSELIGPRLALLAATAGTAATLVGVGWLASSWLTLLPFMFLGGTANTVTQVATNHLITRRVPARRMGLAFGIKQSAIPAASMLAGIALPVLGLTVGWRATYLLAALGFVPVVALLLRVSAPAGRRGRRARSGDAPIRVLILVSLGAGLATAAGNATTAFTVAAADDAGFTAAGAGLLLMGGSLAGITLRVGGGWLADRLGRGSLLLAGGLIGLGVLGYLGLAAGTSPIGRVIATLVAFAGGWGFPALILLSVARTNPRAPATAMGVARLGPSLGAIFGPLAFGALVDGPGYPAAWLMAAASALLSAVLLLAARPLLKPYRAAPGEVDPEDLPTT
jgi:MFS family permease